MFRPVTLPRVRCDGLIMTMRSLILHIGMNKTGSSALQTALAQSRSGSDWTFIAPVIPNASNVVHLAFHPKAPSEPRRKQGDVQTPGQAIAALEGAFAAVDAPRGVMSGEGMFNLGEASIPGLVNLARAHAEDIGAVAYIRPPVSFLVSNYQQRMKQRHVPLGKLQRPAHLRFDRSAGAWEDILGAENVALRPYDRGYLSEGSVIADFAELCGLGELRALPQEKNPRLSGEAMRLLVQYRRRVPRHRPGDGRIIGELSGLSGPSFALAASLLGPAREAARQMRGWALDRMDWDMAEPPGDPDARPVASEADFDDILPRTTEWLAARTGRAASTLRGDMEATAEAVAALAHIARGNSADAVPLWLRALGRLRPA